MEAPRGNRLDVHFLTAAANGDISKLARLTEKHKNGEGPGKVSYSKLKTPEGHNALNLAAQQGNTDLCRFLIENLKFDVDEPAAECHADGSTSLFLSCLHAHLRTTIYLIENGADVRKRNVLRESPLHFAATNGSKETIELLISKGADVNAMSVTGTPLHLAVLSGNHVALKYLLDRNANPNPSTSFYELTPLFAAIQSKARECVKLLLEAGADPNHPCYNMRPVKVASSYLDGEIIECMLRAGANPNLQDPYKCTKSVFAGIAKENAVKAVGRESYGDALAWFYKEADAAGEVNAKLLSNISFCQMKLNFGHQALAQAQSCIRLEPRWAKAHYREGAAWNILTEFEKAAQSFSKALTCDPGNQEIKKAYMEARAQHNKFKHWK